MKEFIDKLIERLEEEPVGNIMAGKDYLISGNAIPKERLVEIVNQLAEEYKATISKTENVGWIAVSERLPEAGKRYLVSVVWKDEFNNYIRPAVYDAVYGKDGLWHTYDYEPVVYEVIAWQPLPAPYTEGE